MYVYFKNFESVFVMTNPLVLCLHLFLLNALLVYFFESKRIIAITIAKTITILNAASKAKATILAKIYPRNNEMIISMPNDTGLTTANHALSTIIMKKMKAKIIVSIPIIVIFNLHILQDYP